MSIRLPFAVVVVWSTFLPVIGGFVVEGLVGCGSNRSDRHFVGGTQNVLNDEATYGLEREGVTLWVHYYVFERKDLLSENLFLSMNGREIAMMNNES